MEFRENYFYKLVPCMNGVNTPGGYIYVLAITDDKVEFIVTADTILPKMAGMFTLDKNDLCKLIDFNWKSA